MLPSPAFEDDVDVDAAAPDASVLGDVRAREGALEDRDQLLTERGLGLRSRRLLGPELGALLSELPEQRVPVVGVRVEPCLVVGRAEVRADSQLPDEAVEVDGLRVPRL